MPHSVHILIIVWPIQLSHFIIRTQHKYTISKLYNVYILNMDGLSSICMYIIHVVRKV